ncbi:HD-GYP domain-containing protein [Streptomyces sp. TLI_171]|uniref:HD-GYP domain-containing protein n=1 Tax=Streptomyces sp. TLI_171 TaxID=1938859 RepID=UPI000C18F336|nr:HD domain-containing phosphohydrolase [Streptomyces sp. TLI_171]RKE21060.1 hypothetical protein BX266_4438 [Streptomyces sp. TLI_171]
MSGRRPGAAELLYVVAAGLGAAAVLHGSVDGVTQTGVALAFTALIALGQCAGPALPGDREPAPVATAVALAYALLGPLHGLPTTHGVLQVAAVTMAGTGLGLGAQLAGRSALAAARKRPRTPLGGLDAAARRLVTVSFAALLFQPLYNAGVTDRLPGPAYGALLAGVAALAALGDAVLAAAQQCARTGLRYAAALDDQLHALLGIGSAQVATGLLLSLLAGEAGLWALPVFCVPLLLAQASFRRAVAVRATTGQTIETLARATEIAGYTTPGHARRVADTACALGRELGLGSRELTLLEYAALMHDIGQLSLVEPVPGGATALLPDPEQQRIARLGSEVIQRTGVPRQVWQQVARLADPCRLADGRHDPTLPLASRIIRVANAHDDLRTAAADRPRAGALDPLEHLRLDAGRGYDPVVLDALARLGRRGHRAARLRAAA